MEPGHRLVPHTADLTLEAWAPSLEQCLAEAVDALVDSVLDTTGVVAQGRREFSLNVANERVALAALLDEVIFLLDADGKVPLATHVTAAGGERVQGWFDVADAAGAEVVGSVPKGVALSGLVLEPHRGGWRCSATVDV